MKMFSVLTNRSAVVHDCLEHRDHSEGGSFVEKCCMLATTSRMRSDEVKEIEYPYAWSRVAAIQKH